MDIITIGGGEIGFKESAIKTLNIDKEIVKLVHKKNLIYYFFQPQVAIPRNILNYLQYILLKD